jgi:hypothetical protein
MGFQKEAGGAGRLVIHNIPEPGYLNETFGVKRIRQNLTQPR